MARRSAKEKNLRAANVKGGLGPRAAFGAAIALLLAVGAYVLLSRNGPTPPPQYGGPSVGVAGVGNSVSESMTERRRRALLEGRVDSSFERPRCLDSTFGRCGSVTAESCGDASLRASCCLSCHKLTCVDTDSNCVAWSQSGECYKNTDYMMSTCCFSCSPDYEDKCTQYPTERPDVAEGDISKIFEAAVANYPQYNPQVLSRDPWVVTFDNLLTDEETDGIIEAVGGKNGEAAVGASAKRGALKLGSVGRSELAAPAP